MDFRYFDAHSHVQGKEYDADRDEILSSMAVEGVGTIAVGVDEDSSRRAAALSQAYKNVFAAVGAHPTDTDNPFDENVFTELAKLTRTVAVGECGLDYFRADDIPAARAKQAPIFEAQIALAASLHKPLMIHTRPSKGTVDAYSEVIDMLQSAKREYGDALTGNIHFFVGGIDEARAFLDIGFTISYTAVITFARDYDDVICFIPRSHILSETDSPYVAPASRRGKRNDPHAVIEVVKAIACIRNEDEETVRRAMIENVVRVFNLGM